MAQKKRKVVVITTQPQTLFEFQRHISASNTVGIIKYQLKLKVAHKRRFRPFVCKLQSYSGIHSAFFASMLFPVIRKKDYLYSESGYKFNPKDNNLLSILVESGINPLGNLETRYHVGVLRISLDVLKKHKIVSESFNEWNEKSEDGKKVLNLMNEFNLFLKDFDLKIIPGLISGKIPGVGFCFERISRK